MKITNLIENTNLNNNPDLATESGLSLHIAVGGKKILFDTGMSPKFIQNAKILGVPLDGIDICIISHGHFDHTGGLMAFLKINKKVKVYMKESAKGDYIFKMGPIKKVIGVPKGVFNLHSERIHFIDKFTEISENVFIITDIEQKRPLTKGNKKLFKKIDGKLIQDDFQHELIAVIKEKDGIVGITGCSHNGIQNMIDAIKDKFRDDPVKAVLGGFHLMGIPLLKNSMAGKPDEIKAIGKELLTYDIPQIYTMHCTGMKAFGFLEGVMGDRLKYSTTGDEIEI